MEDPQANTDPVSALSNVQDDEAQMLEAQYWAVDLVLAGVTPEAVVSDLVEQGWSADLAEEIAERARKATRAQRGLVTREDIASSLNSKYRRSQKRAAVVFRFLLVGLILVIVWVLATNDLARRSNTPKSLPTPQGGNTLAPNPSAGSPKPAPTR